MGDELSGGVFDIPVVLAEALEPQRAFLEGTIARAQERIVDFAERQGWDDLVSPPFADRAEFHATKDSFDEALRDALDLDDRAPIPATACAALENRRLIAVVPETYLEIYPEGDEPQAFEKLLAHEIAHRLHVRILDGEEDAMGPIWFFEGFAIVAADQFEADRVVPGDDEVRRVLDSVDRGSYRVYGRVLRRVLGHVELATLVGWAARGEVSYRVADALGLR